MYIHVWNKYLPIIRILMKKTAAGEQNLSLNRIDFERAGSARKSGYKFNIELKKGTVSNVISGSPLAMDLATVLLGDGVVKGLLVDHDFSISLTPKFHLIIVRTSSRSVSVDNEDSNKEIDQAS